MGFEENLLDSIKRSEADLSQNQKDNYEYLVNNFANAAQNLDAAISKLDDRIQNKINSGKVKFLDGALTASGVMAMAYAAADSALDQLSQYESVPVSDSTKVAIGVAAVPLLYVASRSSKHENDEKMKKAEIVELNDIKEWSKRTLGKMQAVIADHSVEYTDDNGDVKQGVSGVALKKVYLDIVTGDSPLTSGDIKQALEIDNTIQPRVDAARADVDSSRKATAGRMRMA